MKKIIIFIFCLLSISLLEYDFSFKLTIIPDTIICLLMSYYILNNLDKLKKIKENKIILLNSHFFAIFMIIGICFEKKGTLSYIFTIPHFLLTICNLVLFTIMFYFLLLYIYNKIDNLNNKEPKNKILKFIFYNHPFLSSFIIVILSSITYLIFYYPGMMSWDGMWQLNYYYDIYTISNHHPALLTLIMGHIMDLGRNLINDNFGMFIYIFIQIIINAFTYAYVLKIMNKMNTPLLIRILSIIFYTSYTYLAVYSITYVKDTMFYLFTILLVTFNYYHFYLNYQDNDKKKYFILALLYLIIYIYRNNGFHVLLILSIVMILFNIRKNKKIVIGFISLLVFTLSINYLYHNVFLVKMNIEEGSIGEALSIPLQQTARYVKYYPNDIPPRADKYLKDFFCEEYKTKLPEEYTPEVSDPVKAQFILSQPSDYFVNNFYKAWITLFFKHPGVYIDATLNNTYGYFYPSKQLFTNNSVITYELKKSDKIDFGNLNLKRNKLKWGRDIIYKSSEYIKKQPGFNILYTAGFYDLVLIMAIFYLIYKKRYQEIIYLTPLIAVLAICIASPVNGYYRYVLPLVAGFPLIIAILCNNKINKKKK